MNPSKGMREYFKIVLMKISFYPRLFRKEYRKSLKFLDPADALEFREWARQKFRRNIGETSLKGIPENDNLAS